MADAVINIRTDSKLKNAAIKVADNLGFSLSALINSYLKNLIRTKTVYVSAAEQPSEFLIQALRVAEEERTKKKHYSFDNNEEALRFLDKVIISKN